MGDFNEVLSREEKFGANEREQWHMTIFQDVVADCGFTDLGYSGLPYTYDNKQDGFRNVKVRLDRALGDGRFLDVLGDTSVKHVQLVKSDYCAVLVEVRPPTVERAEERRRRTARPFRCEDMWFRHEGYKEKVQQVWDPGPVVPDLALVCSSLRAMQGSLKTWEREVFGVVRKQVKETREEIEKKRSQTLHRSPSAHERRLVDNLSKLLAREKAMEWQRSRVMWLHEGDRNTNFFQAKAWARGRTNKIRALKRDDGTMATGQEELENMANVFDQTLFHAQVDLKPERICCFVPWKVTDQMNELLDRPFRAEEVEAALFRMGRAPGVDGFNAGFF